MKITVKEAAKQASKAETTIRTWIKKGHLKARKADEAWQISLASLEAYLAKLQSPQGQPGGLDDETISKMAAKVVSEMRPFLQNTVNEKQPEPTKNHKEDLEALCEENQAWKERVVKLENEIKTLKTTLGDLAARLQSQQAEQPSQADRPKEEPGKTSEAEQAGQAEPEVDEEKAEEWLREHTAEWLNQPCAFKRASGRSWAQLGRNQGGKIKMNGKGKGKGEQSPRAYLHAIENWMSTSPWNRMKAKIALEIGKARKPGNHYGRLEKVGG